jgi:hypothetical protein
MRRAHEQHRNGLAQQQQRGRNHQQQQVLQHVQREEPVGEGIDGRQ